MGAGHGHGAATGQGSAAHRWRLKVSFGLVFLFFFVELVVGIWSNSLALISDAGHMAADVTTLGAALVATRIASRPDSTGMRTFGSYRAEIFASGFAVLVMLGVSVYIVVEAIGRIGQPVELATGPVLLVGTLGLVVNLIAIALLRSGSKDSLNVKGAYLEVIADTVGSVGVIASGLLVMWTGNAFWDTVIALAIGLFVAVRAVMLGREVLAVLGQHAPSGAKPDDVADVLGKVSGVTSVHDLHVWTLTSGMNVATAHLAIAPGTDHAKVLDEAQAVMRKEFGVEHATFQVENEERKNCQEISW
ncbi:cation diffusion facilitator family transporter [Knoellia koreensis]|uniref:Cation transporter n=1 Tax=Knoellia koreensis TaxID=2730921 RepID=A0A849H963_9MICO|nr:cation diffusion facilitator family transporter [Knoellia sp. DB2414S]NNM44475.1 cation transporter [Knoellia sp. DB2414S]